MKIRQATNWCLLLAALTFAMLPLFGALSSSVQVRFGHDQTSSTGISPARDNLGHAITRIFGNGSGSAQVADLVYHGSRTLGSEASETIDLFGSVTDAFGSTLSFARVKAITIENESGSMTLTIGDADSPLALFDPATATVTVPPLGFLCLAAPLAGWPVTDTTADELKVLNSAGATTTYKIHILGASQ